MVQSIRDYFNTLTQREKAFLSLLAVVFLAITLWFFAIVPFNAWRNEIKKNYIAIAKEAEDVKRAAAIAQSLTIGDNRTDSKKRSLPADATDIRIIVSATTQAAGLALSRIQPENTTGLNVWLDDVDTSVLMAWLYDLYNNHGISAAKANIQRGKENTVRAQFLLMPAVTQSS